MRVALVFPGLPQKAGGAFIAGVSQARAISLLHDVHVCVLGEPDEALLAELGRQVPGPVHNLRGAPGRVDRDIRELLLRIRADVVQFESLTGAEWVSDPPSLGPKTIFRAYDATFAVVEQSLRSPVNTPVTQLGHVLDRIGLRRRLLSLEATRLRHREKRVARRFDRVICFSEEDQAIFRSLGVRAGFVPLPMNPSLEPHRPEPDPVFRLAFVASFTYFPNVDALSYLLKDILPNLGNSLAWRLDVVGAEPPAFAAGLSAGGRVRLLGYVDDLVDVLKNTDAFLVPLRFGGGVKLKTMTALGLGIATISTHAGCTGLAVRDGEHLLVRDNARDFAQAIGTLAASRDLRERLGDAGRRMMAEAHAPRVVAEALSVEYQTLVGGGKNQTFP